MNSRNATTKDFQEVMELLRNKQFAIDQYITHRVHYQDMIATFDAYLNPANGVIKALVDWK